MCKRLIYIIFLFVCALSARADNTISIPLTMSVFKNIPMDGPTGSTPDPTDPNQFKASLTGNTLLIQTQNDAVSYVVIREEQSDRNNEDYFYGLSYGEISCPITHAGLYTIRIGYWKTDFIGYIQVLRIIIADLNGHLINTYYHRDVDITQLPPGYYLLRVETTAGATTYKFYKRT